MNKFVRILVVVFVSKTMYSQNVTFSNSGETGSSGTNWSLSSNVLLVASGGASINVSVITNHLTNIGDLEVRAISASTNQNIIIDSPINYTGSNNRTLTLRSRNDIQINQSIIANTTALNLILSTADAGDGEATIRNNISTNGGSLVIGGQWNLGTQLWNGLTIPSNYSLVTTESRQGIDILNATINTNGGNVRMYGMSYVTSTNSGYSNYGIEFDKLTLVTGSGSIELNGNVNGKYLYGGGIWLAASTGATSISSTTGSVSILGNGADELGSASSFRHGIMLMAKNGYGLEVKTTSGELILNGTAQFSFSTDSDKSGLQLQVDGITSSLKLVSQSGNISIKGTNSDEGDGQYNNAIRFSAADIAGNIKIGYDGTTAYSGTILIEGNSLYQRNQHAGSGSISIKTTGAIFIQPKNNSFTFLKAGESGALTLDDDWDFGTTASSFTFGKITNTKDFTMLKSLTVNGAISIFGGVLSLSGTYTSTNTGDIWIKSNATNVGSTPSIYFQTDVLKTGGNRSKLLMQAMGRINYANPKKIEATNTALDVILWSDFDNSNNDGGTTLYCDITTNGGHVWLGGSNSNAGSMTWNGLTVGDGPSIGTSGSTNYNAMDFSGNVTTSGGDIFIWTGDGYTAGGGISGIEVFTTNKTLNAGSGEITLITNSGVKTNSLILLTTGQINIAPNATGFTSNPFVFSGTTAANTFTGSGNMNKIVIQNPQSVAQLNIGYYSNSNGLSFNNASAITIGTSYTTNGAIFIKGSTINLNGAVTANNNKITLAGSGTVSQTQPITANELQLFNSGSFSLTNTSNTINSISGGSSLARLSSLNLINSGAFVIGNTGVYTSGTLSLASQIGTVTVSYPVNTSNTSSNAIQIVAGKMKFAGDGSGGDVVISSSDNIVVGAGGTAKIYGGSDNVSVFPGMPSVNKRYYVDTTTISFFPSISSGNYLLLREAQNKWTGALSSSWNLAGNWSANYVPTIIDDVVIDSNGANPPILDVDFVLGTSNNFKITNTGTLTVASGKALTIEGNADFGDKAILFKSDANGSGTFGPLTGSLTGINHVTVERFIPGRRAFRFISSSVTTTTSIRENWQENGINNNGYGTHITGTGSIANGFDATITNNPSLFTYSNSSNTWLTVSNTNSTTLIAGVPFRLMVRGNRTTDMSTNNPADSDTTLRANGLLFTGSKTLSGTDLNQNPQGSSFVGNPYQAPLNIKSALTTSTNMNANVVYYWDPTLNSRGGYVTRDLVANSNDVTSDFNEFLQPGQAVFIVKSNTTNPASITFSENQKSIVNAAAGVFRTTNQNSILRTKLLTNTDNFTKEIDAALVQFHSDFSVQLTDEDASKMYNLDEQVSFKINNKLISINKTPNPQNVEELVLDVKNYRKNNYVWQIETTNYNGLQPYLFDSLNQTYTLIQTNGLPTMYPFSVNSNQAASIVSNRFKIVFSTNALALPKFETNFTLFPNPSTDNEFLINVPTWGATCKVQMFNNLGQKIAIDVEETLNYTKHVSIQNEIATGVYFIEIEMDGVRTIKKWIKN